MFGLFGGYLTSDLDFDQTNTVWTYEGPTVGAYATYLDHAFYVEATMKVDFLDIDIDADDIAPGAGDAGTDAFNIGGQIDTGYNMPFGSGFFVEPQASLAVVHTEIDDIDDIFGGAVEFDDETSVRGRLGLRVGRNYTASDGIVYSGDVTASVWEDFSGDNGVTIFAPLTPATGVSDDPGETFGDVSLGFSALGPDGWSGFLRGNYAFAEDYEAVSGNAGVRYAW
jgi:outer membrane autotransporter protein